MFIISSHNDRRINDNLAVKMGTEVSQFSSSWEEEYP